MNGPDWRDVASAVAELSTDLNATIHLTITPTKLKSQPSLCLTAQAVLMGVLSGGVPLSVSVSKLMGTGAGSDLSGALLFLLYDLDSKCAAWIEDVTWEPA